MRDLETLHAVRRFGLGARPGDTQRIGSDPRGYVRAALDKPETALLEADGLEPSHVVLKDAQIAQAEVQAARDRKPPDAPTAVTVPGADPMNSPMMAGAPPGTQPQSDAPPAGMPELPKPVRMQREATRAEAEARIGRALATDTPMVERLVQFWSNHFCVSANKGVVRGLAGSYEREAIRPHVLGSFEAMLKSVVQHPAMLIYLDNQQSVGPTSPQGQRLGRGLNENLAREILELHTLGVDGGYTQTDVTNLARLLTGWTVGSIRFEQTDPGRFFFGPGRHEEGRFELLGKTYGARRSDGRGFPDRALAAGERALADLARHPATARHVARKLARHFVHDDPPQPLVARLERTFRDSQGDLGRLARTLVQSDEAWAQPPRKIVPPYDFLISVVRGFALEPKPREILRLSAALGQPIWRPPAPSGWPDSDEAWMAPASLRERLRIAERAANEAAGRLDPRAAAEDLLGSGLSEATRQAIARAETRGQGLQLLAMAPEFQRR